MPKSSPIRPTPPRIPSTLARQITWYPVDALKAWDHNARTHSDRQLRQLAASIREFGFIEPLLIDEQKRIIAGHGRLAAAKLVSLTEVPTLVAANLTEAQKRALVIAHNRLAELAGWDRELLKIELGELGEIDYAVELTGFSTGEIDVLLDEPATAAANSDDTLPDVPDGPAVSTRGDVWQLGPHRIACGDALKPESYSQLLGREKAQMAFADPPYNVPVNGHVSGLGKRHHREFAMASGEMSATEFIAFLTTSCTRMTEALVDGAIAYVCMDWAHTGELLTAAAKTFGQPKQMCVWTKTNGGMGGFYRSAHEIVWVLKNGTGRHINNFGLGEHGRYRTNVWNYAGANSFNSKRDEMLALHPTVKPTALVADAIRDCSKRNGLILDPFGGSGTTLIAAERTGRIARLIEFDPLYVDVAVRRWEEMTGMSAKHSDSNATFRQIEQRRLAARPRMTKPARRTSTKAA
jgi:DNA modification methylase